MVRRLSITYLNEDNETEDGIKFPSHGCRKSNKSFQCNRSYTIYHQCTKLYLGLYIEMPLGKAHK